MHLATQKFCLSKLLNDSKTGYFQVSQEENIPEWGNISMSCMRTSLNNQMNIYSGLNFRMLLMKKDKIKWKAALIAYQSFMLKHACPN